MHQPVKPARPFSDDLLTRCRQQGDAPADAVIAAVAQTGDTPAVRDLMRWLASPKEVDPATQPRPVQAFFDAPPALPDWASPKLMERGMQFFKKHTAAIALTLGCYSLPYCYLGADGARVLWLSQRIHNDTRRRLEETGDWIFSVTRPRNWQDDTALRYTLKIRLMHAAIRWFTLRSGQWDLTWGYPVNQEDMAGTNLAFSYIVIRGLRQAGVTADEADEEAYLHHLNVVGSLLGVADELLPRNLREAYLLDKAIAARQFGPSEQGRGLTKSLLHAIESMAPAPLRNLPAAQMRSFLGDAHADLLGIPDVPFEKRLVGLASALPIFPKVYGL